MRKKEEQVRVLGVVQARMGSTRLPGKVLMKIGSKTALEWTVERVKMANTVDEVIIATTTNKADRPILELCRKRGWPVHCGSEEDVLGRTLEAATIYSPNVIVDVTSDCPFADPRHVDLLVASIFRKGVDYASNIIPRSWPDGLDVQAYKMNTLLKVAETSWANREHSGWNITQAPWPFLKKSQLVASNKYMFPKWRLTLDTAEDLEVLRACWAGFIFTHPLGDMFPATSLLDFIMRNPYILTNSEVRSTTPGVHVNE